MYMNDYQYLQRVSLRTKPNTVSWEIFVLRNFCGVCGVRGVCGVCGICGVG